MISKYLNRRIFGLLVLMSVLAWPVTGTLAADPPTDVKIAIMYSVGPEAAWDKTVREAMARVIAEKPHNLNISYDAQDAVYGEKAEAVMKLLAKSGKYDIIMSNSAHSDQIKNLRGDYPDIMWVSLGSGNYNTGSNHYLAYGRVHQAAYLLGVLAGGMSKSGVIGVVGSFPAEDINDQINAYRAGARSVNPNAKLKLTFIESWWDPPKAIEATYAQVAAGAEVIYQLAGSVYDACKDKGILCLSKYRDEGKLAPDVVLSGTVLKWDPSFKWILGEWYKHKTEGMAFAGNKDPKWFTMAEGGSDIAPYYDLASRVPDDLQKKVAKAKADIISGKLDVPVVLDVPTPDS